MYIPRGVRYGTVRRYVLLGTGTVRVPYPYCIPAPYPHRTHTQCTYPRYVPTVRPRTDAQVVPSFRVPGHPIEHNA